MKKYTLIYFILISISLIFAKYVDAQDLFEYFSYAPRTVNKFDISLFNEIKQDFKIFDDNLSKIYIWLENPGLPNTLEIKLLQKNTILFSKTLNVPQIKTKFYGEKFEINLGNNIKIKSGEVYTLTIKNINGDEIYIYYSNKIQLLQNIEEFSEAPLALGNFYINEKEYPYYLKISIAENKESDPPEIINPQINIESPYKVNILFNVTEPIKYKFVYIDTLTNESYLVSQTNYLEYCFKDAKACKVVFYTMPNKYYKFQLSIIDYWGNYTTYEGSFTTPMDPNIATSTISTSTFIITDNIPPEISNFEIKEITDKNIIITFQTNEFAKTKIEIFFKETGVMVMEIRNGIFDISHKFTALDLLFPNLEYNAVIYAEDFFGNISEYKFSFKTLKGEAKISLQQFLSNPKKIDLQISEETTSLEFKLTDIQINFNTDNNKLKINSKNEITNLDLIKKPNLETFSYRIKEGNYELDLNILSPGAYTYVVYQELKPKVKKILTFGEAEIKPQINKKEVNTEIETKNESKNELTKKTTKTTFESKSLIDYKNKSKINYKLFLLIGIILIIFVLLAIIKFKKQE